MSVRIFFFWIFLVLLNCTNRKTTLGASMHEPDRVGHTTTAPLLPLRLGCERTELYVPQLSGKRVALVVNHTSMLGEQHLADTLLRLGVNVVKIFAPEHGFRGTADAGEIIQDGRDSRTGLPIVSLYGKNKKPTRADLANVDVVIFDIQDVGARFYTYISTLFFVQQACAETGKRLLVLDRPNPNGHYIDGQVLQAGFGSFVGIAPIPIVHGCTVGELARMFAGENWIQVTKPLDFEVISCENYHHSMLYELPVAPSPNLTSMRAIYLYPSLCLFEGTVVSVGRGTDFPFEVVGHPDFPQRTFSFVPQPNAGNKTPLFVGKTCYGMDFRDIPTASLLAEKQILLSPLLTFFAAFPEKNQFFLKNNFFDKLAGSDSLRLHILNGKTETQIRESWQADLARYRSLRQRYVLYD